MAQNNLNFPDPSPQNVVQFYSEHAQELLKTQKQKILKLLEARSIEYAGSGLYICKPIPGYNKTTYRMTKDPITSDWACTCQHFVMTGENCSHIGALYEFFARGQRYS